MSRAPSDSAPTPEQGQQMDRSNDPEITAALDEIAPEAAMDSRRERLAGSAVGVGSIGFEEAGAYDVGAGRPARPKRDDDD
jgi:hypothetical protein